jgi:hypothetical protein
MSNTKKSEGPSCHSAIAPQAHTGSPHRQTPQKFPPIERCATPGAPTSDRLSTTSARSISAW